MTERAASAGASMSLLDDMAGAALDPGYAEAAKRGPRREPSRGAAVLASVLLLAGVAAGVAAAQVRHKAGDAGAARRSLVAEVRRQTQVSDRLASQVAALRQDVAAVQSRALGEGGRGKAASRQLGALGLATGVLAVQGQGLIVRLDDANGASDGRIYDRDVQDVVNALWAAGAEAIAVNGQRLTGETAIRSAGEAILVDFRPLSPPYVLSAIGGIDTIEPAFVDSPTARRFKTWTSLYGLGFTVSRSPSLHLPAATAADLRLATPTRTGT